MLLEFWTVTVPSGSLSMPLPPRADLAIRVLALINMFPPLLFGFEATDPFDGVAIASDGQIDGFRAAADRQSVGAVRRVVHAFQVEGGGRLQMRDMLGG